MPSSHGNKPKPSEVAAETKRYYIPAIRREYAHRWPTHSYLFHNPLEQLPPLTSLTQISNPNFYVCSGDPVDLTINWRERESVRIPFICVANDKRPGGDWETGVVGYEERLCRRSNLSATLSTPGPGSEVESNYPIPSQGGVYSEFVVVFRGPHDQYAKLNQWYDLPVVSVPPARWPKLVQSGLKYAFPIERDLVKNKLRAALKICAYYGHRSIVIGDFGLGNNHRNPPQEIAELWREIFLYDPDIRGRFEHVAFVFEDPNQSTTKLILDDISKKNKSGSSGSSKGKSKSQSSASSSSHHGAPTDFDIFQHVFDPTVIQDVMGRTDPRYGISMLTS
ncbi:hypothetical protein F5X96DRAFT_687762 [Biscogniauxia mediterranea]|nr:hypothetical protein F5X96DRAFT_687762 [Biscogniauxia mediterranea]